MKLLRLLMILLVCSPMVFAGVTQTDIPTPPNFFISSSMTNLCKGQVNYIPITITNGGVPPNLNIGGPNLLGPQMQNVQLSLLNSRNAFIIRNGTIMSANVNAANSTTTLMPIFINANASSIVSLGISINYYYYTFYQDIESRNLTFIAHSCPVPLSASVSPKTLTSGSTENLMVNLTNNGNTTLQSISLRLNFPSQDMAWLGDQQPIQIDSIAPMSTLHLNESVYVSINATQFFPLNITATFYNGSNLGQISKNLLLLSSGVISLTPSSLTLSPETPSPSSVFSISFVLTNLGTTGASTVTVTALPPKDFVPFGSNSVFVGSVPAGGQTPVTLTFTVSNRTAVGSYRIPIEVNYLNSLRNNQSMWFNVSVAVARSGAFNASRMIATGGGVTVYGSRSPFSFLTIILVVIIIVLLILFIRERRKRRHGK